MRHEYYNLGNLIAGRFGINNTERTAEDIINSSTEQRQVMFLLSALVQQVKKLNSLAESRPPKPDEPSDGMLDAFRMGSGNVKVRECPEWHSMSVRERKAISHADIKFVHEITQERLTGIRHCGQTTINELLDFKFKKLYPTNESNDQ